MNYLVTKLIPDSRRGICGLVIPDGFMTVVSLSFENQKQLKDIMSFHKHGYKVQKTTLAGNPVFKVVFQQLESWFSGRYAALVSEYQARIIQKEPAVILEFVPHPTSMTAKALKSVRVTFREDERYLKSIVIQDLSGDETRLNFSKTVLNQPIPAAAWEVRPRER